MSERRLMENVVRLVAERRRLWPADGASSVACLGLLGWVNEVYLHPQQALQELMGWLWMGGVVGNASGAGGQDAVSRQINGHTKTQGGSGFDAADQQAIDAYAAGVAGQLVKAGVLTDIHLEPVNTGIAPKWTAPDLRALMALGRRHGAAMREVLHGVLRGFECGQGYEMPLFGAPNMQQEAEEKAKCKAVMNPRWVGRGEHNDSRGEQGSAPSEPDSPAAVRRLRESAISLNAGVELAQEDHTNTLGGQDDGWLQVLGFALQMNAQSQLDSPLNMDAFASGERASTANSQVSGRPDFLKNESRRF